jgi:hypothetical protein
MSKNTIGTDTIKQIKQGRKDKFQHNLRVFGLSVWFAAYGIAVLVSIGHSSITAFGVDLNLTRLERQFVLICNAIALGPVAYYIGLGFFRRGIVGVLRELAEKETKA